MLNLTNSVLKKAATGIGRSSNSRPSQQKPHSESLCSHPITLPTTHFPLHQSIKRGLGGGLFGGSGIKNSSVKNGVPKAPASMLNPQKSSSKSKVSSIKPKSKVKIPKPIPRSFLESEGAPTVSNLEQLKEMIKSMPPEALLSFPPELQEISKSILEGNLDKLDQDEISRSLKNASLVAQSDHLHEQKPPINGMDPLEDKELEFLAQKTMEALYKLPEEEWKAHGLTRPDFSKPITLEQLISFDRLLAQHGISMEDFEKYLSPQELEELKSTPPETEEEAELIPTPVETKKTKKKLKYIEEFDNVEDLEKQLSFKNLMKKFHQYDKDLERKEFKKAGLKPGDLAETLLSLTIESKHIDAISIFQNAMTWDPEIVGFEPIDANSIAIIVSAYCAMNSPSGALKTMELFEKYGFDPTVLAYNSFIQLYALNKNAEQALHWYHKLLENNVKPDSMTFNALISLYAQLGDPINAVKWFKEMRAIVEKPDATAYAHMIHLYGIVLDDLAEAINWATQLHVDEVPKNEFCRKVIGDLYEKWSNKQAEMRKAANEKPKSIQDEFIQASKRGNRQQVEKIWDSMVHNKTSIPENFYSLMMTHYNATAQLEKAKELLQQMEDECVTPSRITCSVLGEVFRRLGEYELSNQWMERVQKAPPTVPVQYSEPVPISMPNDMLLQAKPKTVKIE